MLKLSRYTLFYNDYPNPGEYLVFHTRTLAVITINQQVKDFIEKATNPIKKDGDFSPVCVPNSGTGSDEEQAVLNTLKDSGIIIESDVDENKLVEHWFNQIKYQSKSLRLTILTTYQCNFGCPYCFEERVKQPKSLDNESVSQIVEWTKRKVDEKQPRSLRLMFYGGEPMMNPKAILDISRELSQWTKEKGVKFSFGMITNGSLLKKEVIAKMKKLGLTGMRITLDGDRVCHDKRRPFLDGRGSFDAIIKNISEIADMVNVGISHNIDKENLDSFPGLYDYLEKSGLSGKISNVVFAPVVARFGEESASGRLPVEMTGCYTLPIQLAEDILKLREDVIQRGYKVDRSAVIGTCPMTHDNSALVIDPYGDIYKCEAFVGRPQFSIGNIRETGFNYRDVEFVTMDPWKHCLDCVYLPMCGGGCRYIAQLKHSDCSKIACDIEFYERVFPKMLKMDYERGLLSGLDGS